MCMKKIFLVVISLLIVSNIYASSMSVGEKELEIEQKNAEFSQQADWINVDSYIDYVGSDQIELTYNTDEETLTKSFFTIFDYVPNTENVLITSESLKDIISIKSEGNIIVSVKYIDKYNNPISQNYPKIFYRKQNSNDMWLEKSCSLVSNNVYRANLSIDYGTYEYFVCATNSKYVGEYKSSIKNIVVTERPHSFVNLNPNLQDGKANTNTMLVFSWNATKGVNSDILKYTFYLGNSKESMKQYDLDTQTTYTIEKLSVRSRYYWKVEVENQYGAQLLNPITYEFVTLGEIQKVYNAPNPFNPLKEKTRIFFEMQEEGNVDLDIYSEYGDKIYHTSKDNLAKGNNEIVYDGKDDYGNTLYNGTYLCVVKKKYSGTTKTERCRLLIIK